MNVLQQLLQQFVIHQTILALSAAVRAPKRGLNSLSHCIHYALHLVKKETA
jgi:hypothetical protein